MQYFGVAVLYRDWSDIFLETNKLIYIADDEKHIRDLMTKVLTKEGYTVQAFSCGEELIAQLYNKCADLVILDVMMQGIDGISVCCMIRQVSTVPIIIVSARDSEIDKVTGINIGCDDYLTKPFSLLELAARVKAIFRRVNYQQEGAGRDHTVSIGNLVLDHDLRKAVCQGNPISFTQLEFVLIDYLIKNQYRAVSRDELLRKIWDFGDGTSTTRATDDTVKRIRIKLADAGANVRIKTIRGYGFTIEEVCNEKENDAP